MYTQAGEKWLGRINKLKIVSSGAVTWSTSLSMNTVDSLYCSENTAFVIFTNNFKKEYLIADSGKIYR